MGRGLVKFLIFILVLLVGWFGVWGGWKKIRDLRASVSDLRETLAEEQEAVRKLAELTQLVKERSAEIAKLEIAVPPKRDLASLIAAFEEAASTNGLALASLDIFEAETGRALVETPSVAPDGSPAPAIFNSVNARVGLSGRYPAFKTFLASLEKSFPLVDATDITVQPPTEGGGTAGTASVNPSLNFTVTLEGYYLANDN